MTGQGGWPMSVFLTPDGQPFYGGTYFPDQPRHGMPAFRQVLASIAAAWRDERPRWKRRRPAHGRLEQAARIAEAGTAAAPTAARWRRVPSVGQPPWPARRHSAAAGRSGRASAPDRSAPVGPRRRPASSMPRPRRSRQTFDVARGGWGGAPKFPPADDHRAPAARASCAPATSTAADHGPANARRHGRGRHPRPARRRLRPLRHRCGLARARTSRRCSTTTRSWPAPTCTPGRSPAMPRYREVARVDARLSAARDARGRRRAFAASLDADTDGDEGATYVWTADEVGAVLGDDARALRGRLRRDAGGQLGGPHDPAPRPRRRGPGRALGAIPADEVARRLAAARERLLAAATRRPQPARDDKVLAAWNGLAIAAFAEAGSALDRPDYADAAETAAAHPAAALRTPTAACRARGRTAGAMHAGRPRGPRRTSPRGCWRCTRPRSTSAGSPPPASWWTSSWTASPTRSAASSTPPTTTRR